MPGTPQDTTTNDQLRQSLTLGAALANPLASWLPQLSGVGRTIEEQSDLSSTLLVPWGPAFSIWLPIFAGLIAYAIVQALPRNRDRALFRRIGWPLIGAMALSASWAIAASYAPLVISVWLTAFILLACMLCAVTAMVIVSRGAADLSALEQWIIWTPISLYAGWTSLAVFLNWEQVFTNELGWPALTVALLLLVIALLWVIFNAWRVGGNWAYVAAAAWGLTFTAVARLIVEQSEYTIGVVALLGVGLIFTANVIFAQTRSERSVFSQS